MYVIEAIKIASRSVGSKIRDLLIGDLIILGINLIKPHQCILILKTSLKFAVAKKQGTFKSLPNKTKLSQ